MFMHIIYTMSAAATKSNALFVVRKFALNKLEEFYESAPSKKLEE